MHRTCISLATLGLVMFGGCAPRTTDPVDQTPMQASETTGPGQVPPSVVAPLSMVPLTGRPLRLTATKLVCTPLSQTTSTQAAVGGGSPKCVDVRIEALDAAGNAARLAGELRILLRCADCDPEYSAFDVRLLDLADEKKVYDETLDLYVFRVLPRFTHAPEPGTVIEITLALNAPDGTVLETRGSVRW
jgi:hypothetical protein